MKCSFDDVEYRHRDHTAKPIEKRIQILGIDSEADIDGKPFLYGLSDGSIYTPKNLWTRLFDAKYRGVKFVCWNLKYDEGAILYNMPKWALDTLRKTGSVEIAEYTVRSIQQKELTISKGHKSVSFYDIAQFFGTSLESAATTYLGKHKDEIETKRFDADYIRDNFDRIGQYCVKDAKLTQELADYFIDILIDELGIYPQKLYSTGYITGIHFSRVCEVQDVKRFWDNHKDLLKFAFNAYSGGKFEVYKRGFGYFYQYDIVSAYPYEIANLRSIKNAEVIHSNEYQSGATYGFLDCWLTITNDYSPVSVKNTANVNRYPAGIYRKTITKADYDYLTSRGDSITIIDGWWLICEEIYPYRAEVMRLFEYKAKYKQSGDKLRYLLVKILLNSFYGKLIQITPKVKADGTHYEAGYLFNPIYATVITDNVRIRLCKVCDAHPDNVLAVHTDSIVSDIDLSHNSIKISRELGDWDYVTEGEGVIVGSGVYQVGKAVHYRGFQLSDKNLIDIIQSHKGKTLIELAQNLVLSWRLIAFRDIEHNKINRFTEDNKTLNLTFDDKREWNSGWTWKHKLIGSKPYVYADKILPEKSVNNA